MQQPTPAPSSPPSSPHTSAVGAPNIATNDSPVEYSRPAKNINSAPFYVLTILFNKLQNERKHEKRRKALDSWFKHWRKEMGYDLYPVLRLILPQNDTERTVYGLKEKNIAKIYIKLIPLNTRDPDAIRLLNWKRPTERDRNSGDFATVVYEVVNKRSSVAEGTLSIDELNDILDELSQNNGNSVVQSKIIQRVYNRTTPEEQRWIIRMIINVKETTVFSVFHPDAHDLFNACSDLKQVVWDLWDPERRLNDEEKSVRLFRAFAPMLCTRPTRRIEDTVQAMRGQAFIMEEKLDGERMQLHKRGNEYFYCSRKGKDYTYLYGKHVGEGSLTPYIDTAFDSRVDEIILDGEMLVWDPIGERHLPFGHLKTAALGSNKQHMPRPCFKIFDLLYLNGMSLLQKSLKFRKRNLRACLKEVPGRVEFCAEYEGQTAKDVRERMEVVMASRGEGVVIKHPESAYVLNGRNKDWIKVKPEYMDNMGETVDVLVVGGYYGSGRRSGGVSTLVCAVLDDRRSNDDDEPKYSTFVRVGTGLSFSDYVGVRSKPWKVWDPASPPTFIQTSPKEAAEDRGDMYLEPHDSFIVKVKAAEITQSDQYHMGFTMRFPRVLSIREDLDIADCMTASAVMASITRDPKKRKNLEGDEKAKKKHKKATVPSLMPEYQRKGLKLKDVKADNDLFKGLKFMVVSDPKSKTGEEDKTELLRLIRKNGGATVQIANKNTNLLVIYGGTSMPYDIKLIVNKDAQDIIRPQWIMDCIAKGEHVPLKKRYFFHATSSRERHAEYNVDDVDESERDNSSPEGPSADKKIEDESKTPEDKEEDDPSVAEWFKIDDKVSGSQDDREGATDSETDPESDEDATPIEYINTEEPDDDWFKVASAEESADIKSRAHTNTPHPIAPMQRDADEATGDHVEQVPSEARMGDDDNAMEYDLDVIFKHLCFYLDSPDNARMHDMTVHSKYEDDMSRSFVEISKLITKNGGRVADMDDPKLTHIVVDKRDPSRRVELMKRTSKPKHRNIVIADFIEACIEEGTLLDEDEFAP